MKKGLYKGFDKCYKLDVIKGRIYQKKIFIVNLKKKMIMQILIKLNLLRKEFFKCFMIRIRFVFKIECKGMFLN